MRPMICVYTDNFPPLDDNKIPKQYMNEAWYFAKYNVFNDTGIITAKHYFPLKCHVKLF